MYRMRFLAFYCLLYLPLIAGPKIEIDKTTFDCGVVVEGKKEKIEALFEIKNTGDSLLRIESVRPGCGCTVVEFDSLIPPGKTGKIRPEVKLKGFSGKIRKAVTVTSNATNTPNLQLFITADIQPLIDISERFINLSAVNNKSTATLFLSSLKKDLAVEEVSFRFSDTDSKVEWQKDIRLPIRFEWKSTDSIRTDGLKVFALSLFCPDNVSKQQYGEFIIKTNHPQKNEIVLSGGIGGN